MRACGDCQLCCKLLPVVAVQKKAGERCRHQRFAKGCAVYHAVGFPPECGVWSCRWLVGDGTESLSRPDRSHYVIDLMPDFVSMTDNATGQRQNVPAIQVWVDPAFPDAHRDKWLREYLELRARDHGEVAIIRYGSGAGFVLFAPCWSDDGQWHQEGGTLVHRTHTPAEIFDVMENRA